MRYEVVDECTCRRQSRQIYRLKAPVAAGTGFLAAAAPGVPEVRAAEAVVEEGGAGVEGPSLSM